GRRHAVLLRRGDVTGAALLGAILAVGRDLAAQRVVAVGVVAVVVRDLLLRLVVELHLIAVGLLVLLRRLAFARGGGRGRRDARHVADLLLLVRDLALLVEDAGGAGDQRERHRTGERGMSRDRLEHAGEPREEAAFTFVRASRRAARGLLQDQCRDR